MKTLVKLALVSAMAISTGAMAAQMQSLDDDAMSAMTGQDGISIGVGISKIAIEKLYLHDNDGLDYAVAPWSAASTPTATGDLGYKGYASASTNAGAITISGNGIASDVNENDGIVISANTAALLASHNLADIYIDTEGDNAADSSGAFLNVLAKVSGLNINIGEIGVAKSGAYTAGSAARGVLANAPDAILSGLDIKTGQVTANIQLGNTPQGGMIALDGTMTGGLELSNIGIRDNYKAGDAVGFATSASQTAVTDGFGQITIGSIKIENATNGDLDLSGQVAIRPSGLVLSGVGAGATNMYIKDISLSDVAYDTNAGAAPNTWTAAGKSIGDVEISNMRVFNGAAGTTAGANITIRGH